MLQKIIDVERALEIKPCAAVVQFSECIRSVQGVERRFHIHVAALHQQKYQVFRQALFHIFCPGHSFLIGTRASCDGPSLAAAIGRKVINAG